MEFLWNNNIEVDGEDAYGFTRWLYSSGPNTNILTAFRNGERAAHDMDAPFPFYEPISIAQLDDNGDGRYQLLKDGFLSQKTYL